MGIYKFLYAKKPQVGTHGTMIQKIMIWTMVMIWNLWFGPWDTAMIHGHDLGHSHDQPWSNLCILSFFMIHHDPDLRIPWSMTRQFKLNSESKQRIINRIMIFFLRYFCSWTRIWNMRCFFLLCSLVITLRVK